MLIPPVAEMGPPSVMVAPGALIVRLLNARATAPALRPPPPVKITVPELFTNVVGVKLPPTVVKVLDAVKLLKESVPPTDTVPPPPEKLPVPLSAPPTLTAELPGERVPLIVRLWATARLAVSVYVKPASRTRL